MRVPDVVWVSSELLERHWNEKEFRVAPDLCVEVLSPTNTRIEPPPTRKLAARAASEVHDLGAVR
jgi:Uma2 family endonuclease